MWASGVGTHHVRVLHAELLTGDADLDAGPGDDEARADGGGHAVAVLRGEIDRRLRRREAEVSVIGVVESEWREAGVRLGRERESGEEAAECSRKAPRA